MGVVDPRHIVFKLVTLLMLLVRKKRGSTEGGGAARSVRAQGTQAEIDPVVVKRNCFRAIARNNLDQKLVQQIGIDIARPGAKNAEIPDEQGVAIRTGVQDAIEWRSEVIVGINNAESDGIPLARLIVKASKDVVQPVRAIEYAVIPGQDGLQRRIIQGDQPKIEGGVARE